MAALTLGPLTLPTPVVLAPMAGVTNSPFRRLCREYGPALYVHEMVSARGVAEGNNRAGAIEFDDDEPLPSVQIYGVDPHYVGIAVRKAIDEHGARHVDLNMGCPVPKVTRLGGGAALPVRHRLFQRIVASAVGAAGSSVPVTVKMRMGIDDETLTYLRCGRIAADEGAAAITLHARTAEQLYSGSARWAAIGELKAYVGDTPVLGNGDIWVAQDAIRMMAQTGCDGVVIGRGCLGRPWLFRDLAAGLAGLPVPPAPTLREVRAVMLRHATLLAGFRGDEGYGTRQFRRHVHWYLTGYRAGADLRRRLALVEDLAQLAAFLDELDPDETLPAESVGLPRGHTQGPRRVTLPAGWRDSADADVVPEGADLAVVQGG